MTRTIEDELRDLFDDAAHRLVVQPEQPRQRRRSGWHTALAVGLAAAAVASVAVVVAVRLGSSGVAGSVAAQRRANEVLLAAFERLAEQPYRVTTQTIVS